MRPIGRPFVFVAAAALAGAMSACQQDYKAYHSNEGGREWELGGTKTIVEVADNDRERQQGLMFRASMPEDHGMLFVFPDARVLNFWMKNTQIPLSIAFIAENSDGTGTVANVEDMQPYVTTPGTVSRKAVRFALEMNQGWFAKHGIKGGDKIALPPWVREIVASENEER